MSSSANMCIVAVYNSVPLSLSLANHNHKIEIQQSTKLFPNINNNHHLTNCNHSHPFRCARLCDHDDGVDCRDGDRTSSFCVYYIPLNPPPPHQQTINHHNTNQPSNYYQLFYQPTNRDRITKHYRNNPQKIQPR